MGGHPSRGSCRPSGRYGQDPDKNNAPDNALVEFGSPHPQPVPAQLSHVLVPDEVTIRKGGTVTFRVNGGGHGIAIYPVSKQTTRDDITADLCIHDATTNLCVDPAFANGDHSITDGKGRQVIASGTNPPFVRLDDPTDRLLGTTTQIDAVVAERLDVRVRERRERSRRRRMTMAAAASREAPRPARVQVV